jgi:hypothetical protein
MSTSLLVKKQRISAHFFTFATNFVQPWQYVLRGKIIHLVKANSINHYKIEAKTAIEAKEGWLLKF